jgi:DNA-binding Lrp family transcriptional regulator
MEIKNKDLDILIELRKNARAQLTQISKKTSIPISTIYERLRTKANGLIKKYVSILDYEKLGFSARANICIKCKIDSKEKLYQTLKNHQNVNSIYRINNGYDFMVEVIFKNIKSLEEFNEFLDEQNNIKSKETFYIIEELVKENFLCDIIKKEIINC